jgi:hypothetical protein
VKTMLFWGRERNQNPAVGWTRVSDGRG